MELARTIGRRGLLAGTAALAGCQQAGTLPEHRLSEQVLPRLDSNRIGYIAVQAPIVSQLRDMFVMNVNTLLDLNATEIYVLLDSPGGAVSVAQDMIAFMDKTHADRGVRFVMHNSGMVASAACYVFLAGQRRLSAPNGMFLFHEMTVTANGAITSQDLQEASVKAQQIERSFQAMLTAKTKLTQAESSLLVRRTVMLTAKEARRDGIVSEILGFALPQEATVYHIGLMPNKAGVTPPQARG